MNKKNHLLKSETILENKSYIIFITMVWIKQNLAWTGLEYIGSGNYQ